MFNRLYTSFTISNMLYKLIYINIIIFLILNIINVYCFMFESNINLVLEKLYLPANNKIIIQRPWTLLTYMFLHNDFLHLLFNMLYLYFGGKLFLDFLTEKQLLHVYIMGGISGAILFIFAYNYIPVLQKSELNAIALGASASILAIIVSIATYNPNYIFHLPFIGAIKLKIIAIIFIILDILSIPHGNAGGHIAHIGGALFGYLYIKKLKGANRYNNNWLTKIKQVLKIFNQSNVKRSRKKDDYQFNQEKVQKQKKIDKILDKIAESGYDSLTKKEKDLLFLESNK